MNRYANQLKRWRIEEPHKTVALPIANTRQRPRLDAVPGFKSLRLAIDFGLFMNLLLKRTATTCVVAVL